jgi:Family of unknown function (DUF6807)
VIRRLPPSPLLLATAVVTMVAWATAHPIPTMAAQSPSSRVYTLTPVADGLELRTPDGRVVFDYLTRKPEGSGLTSPSAACFHPLMSPGGERITALAPDDHPHHRGMYLAWHDAEFRQPIDTSRMGPDHPLFGWNITKADFWGWGQYAPRDGRVVQNRSVTLASTDLNVARLEIRNDWLVGQRKMIDETTDATVSERQGVFVIDLQFRIAPVVDYQINKAAFSGFSLQARKDGQSYYTNASGKVEYPDPHYSVPELNWPAAPWYGYVITLGNGRTLGAAVIDHPLNPPSTWHNSRTLWMLNPDISALGPYTIHPDAPLTLRYRVVVHDGPTPTTVVNTLAQEFRK